MLGQRAFAVLASLLMAGGVAQAAESESPDSFPSRPVTLIVPFPPAGGADTLARPFAQHLGEYWGQSVVVENRGGAGGNLGAAAAARAAADGYTLLLIPVITLAANQSLYKSTGYDALNDFSAITMVVSTPNILAVNPSLPVKTVQELIDEAKAKPDQLNFATPGNGTPPHLATEIFMRMADVKLTHIPYKGTGAGVTDLIAGRVQVMMVNAPAAIPFIKTGQLRGLATTSPKRPTLVSDLPTLDESGLEGYEADTWYGLFAPAGTPKEIIAKLNADVVHVLNSPALKKTLSEQGAEIVGDSPEAATTRVREDVVKWRDVIEDIGLKMD